MAKKSQGSYLYIGICVTNGETDFSSSLCCDIYLDKRATKKLEISDWRLRKTFNMSQVPGH